MPNIKWSCRQAPRKAFAGSTFYHLNLTTRASQIGLQRESNDDLSAALDEAGHITYMRTDSFNLSNDALLALLHMFKHSTATITTKRVSSTQRAKVHKKRTRLSVQPTSARTLQVRMTQKRLRLSTSAPSLHRWQRHSLKTRPLNFQTRMHPMRRTYLSWSGDYVRRFHSRIPRRY